MADTAETNGAVAGPTPLVGRAETVEIVLSVNGRPHRLDVLPSTTLLDALRDRLHLSGAKKGCALGQCGACTVIVDGRRIVSCLALAIMQQGKGITTVEGLAAPDGTLHPLQQSFVEHDAFQCGYCTPGQIMSALGLILEGGLGSDEEIREGMAGNICRCGAYTNIVDAIREAAPAVAAGLSAKELVSADVDAPGPAD